MVLEGVFVRVVCLLFCLVCLLYYAFVLVGLLILFFCVSVVFCVRCCVCVLFSFLLFVLGLGGVGVLLFGVIVGTVVIEGLCKDELM